MENPLTFMGTKFGNMRKLRRDEEEEPGARRDKVEEILAKMSQAEKTAVVCFRGDLHEWSDRSEKVVKVADMVSSNTVIGKLIKFPKHHGDPAMGVFEYRVAPASFGALKACLDAREVLLSCGGGIRVVHDTVLPLVQEVDACIAKLRMLKAEEVGGDAGFLMLAEFIDCVNGMKEFDQTQALGICENRDPRELQQR